MKKYTKSIKYICSRKIFSVFAFTLAVFLAGCGKAAEISDKNGSDKKTAIEIPKHIEKQLAEGIYVDADVSTNLDPGGTLYIYDVKTGSPDIQEIQDAFFSAKDQLVQNDQGDTSHSCHTPDERKNASWGEEVTYLNKDHQKYYMMLSFGGDSCQICPESFSVETVGELPFMTAEKAKEILSEASGKAGMPLADEPYVFYALDEAALQTLYDEFGTGYATQEVRETYLPGVDFQGDQGCYYMIWQQAGPHGETISSGNLYGVSGSDSYFTTGAFVMAIVSTDGLVRFQSNVKYDYISEDEITETLISVDEALDLVAECYENIILEEDLHIQHISLLYATRLEDFDKNIFKMTPVWRIETSKDDYRVYLVDALAGELI